MTATTVWQEVGDNCFRRRYAALDLNVGVVRGDDGLLVVDTRSHGGEAGELLDELGQLGGPVRQVVNTHWHYDHLFGNDTFQVRSAATPSEQSVRVAADLPIHGHCGVPAMLARHGPGRRDREEGRARERGDLAEAAAYAAVRLVPPNRLVTDRDVLDRTGRAVELRFLGRGHTDTDLVVWVPDAGVAYLGDLVEESAPPVYGDDSFPLDWAGTLTRVLDSFGADGPPSAAWVPGHGDTVDPGFVRRQRDDLAVVSDLFRDLHGAGVPAGQALAAGGGRWPFPAEVLVQAVDRAYAELDRRHGGHQ